MFKLPKAFSKVNFLKDDTYRWVCDRKYVIAQTKRAKCTSNKEIYVESVSEARSELVYKVDKKSTTSF